MSALDVFVRRPVMAIAINLILFILGMVAFYQIELRLKPHSAINEVNISTAFPGANSLAVEYQVTKPLEDALAGLDGIKKLRSSSENNVSNIFVQFKAGVDSHKILSQVRDRVLATSSSLPKAVKRSNIEEQGENDLTIMYVKFEDPTRSIPMLSDYIRRNVEDRLRLVEGVATVGNFGNQIYMVAIKPDPALLAEHQVTVQEVVHALKREKTFASGGEIEGTTGKETVVLTAVVEKPRDFEKIVVKNSKRGRITIGNIASVSLSHQTTFLKMRVDGQDAVGLSIVAKPKANPLTVAENVQNFMDDLQKNLPATMKASISFDATKAFMASMTEMRHTLWEAIILVGIIVTFALGSMRAALLPMITIPVCLVGTFALMLMLGFSLNPVTLLALVLAVGLVVDDAIVVVENIYRHMEEGLSAYEASKRSMKEISFAVIVMTVTLAAVYLPLLYQVDESAVIFQEFAWTLAGSVIISGFVALTLTPALCGKFLKKPKKMLFWDILSAKYRMGLELAMQHPRKIYLLLVMIALIGVFGFQRLPSEIIPAEDEGYLSGGINTDNMVAEPVREDWFKSVEAVLNTLPEKERVMTGVYQDKWMWWNLILKPIEQRKRTGFKIAQDLKSRFKAIVGPVVNVNESQNFGGGESLKIILQYAGEQEPLLSAAKNIMKEARGLSGFSDFSCEQTFEKAHLKVIVDRALASELGISIEAIEDTLYTFLSGQKAADFNFQGLDYDVVVRAPMWLRSEIENLNTYFVANAEGQWVPLGSLVHLKEVLEPSQIKHYDRMRGAEIIVSLQPGKALDKAMNELDSIIKKHLPNDARYQFGGKGEQYQESTHSLYLTFGLALAFIYLVLAALFESFVHPLVVLLTVPLSIAGAVWAINGIGGTNNVYMIIGLVTLIGLISKHGILIVDFANRLRDLQYSTKEAVVMAAESRFRPVLMTTFAMVCGAIPLIFSKGTGAIAKAHIGWVIIGGMLVGTIFSLFVVPVVYAGIGEKIK